MLELSLLFVHSPLVGPSSLRRDATEAARRGHEVALPDLTSMASSPSPHERYVRLATAAARTSTSPALVIGHSGAGAFLPTIGRGLDRLAGLVFVDAVVPPRTGAHRTPDAMRDLLNEHTTDGLLAPWLDWWPPEVVRQLLADPADEAELRADMPHLPRSFYDLDVAVPDGWAKSPCAYLRLSTAYEAEAAEAAARGWPTAVLDSTHLGTHTKASRVLTHIEGLAGRLDG